jgi:hypothetical protein
MNWLLTALVFVWVVPPVAVAVAAVVYRFSGTFRAWLEQVLFGESLVRPQSAGIPIERVVRSADREAARRT